MDRSDRPFLHDPGEKDFVLRLELGQRARRENVDQPLRPLLVEPDHPVQRLSVV
jgi:hypothetical protein